MARKKGARGKSTNLHRLFELMKVETDDCVEWPFSVNGHGYPQVWDGKKNRIASHIVVPDVPEGMVRFHTCDNKNCLNRRHILVKTQSENIAYATGKGRTHTSPEERELMFSLRREGISKLGIAKRLGRSWVCVHYILEGLRHA
jgi:hypothetical protein